METQSKNQLANQEEMVLSHKHYYIGTGLPGSVLLDAYLSIDAFPKYITGYSVVSQTANPPLKIKSRLEGDYTYMTVMPDKTHILVVITGYLINPWPPHGGLGPISTPNLHLRMVMAKDWLTGTASFSYLDKGEWKHVDDVPVKLSSSE